MAVGATYKAECSSKSSRNMSSRLTSMSGTLERRTSPSVLRKLPPMPPPLLSPLCIDRDRSRRARPATRCRACCPMLASPPRSDRRPSASREVRVSPLVSRGDGPAVSSGRCWRLANRLRTIRMADEGMLRSGGRESRIEGEVAAGGEGVPPSASSDSSVPVLRGRRCVTSPTARDERKAAAAAAALVAVCWVASLSCMGFCGESTGEDPERDCTRSVVRWLTKAVCAVLLALWALDSGTGMGSKAAAGVTLASLSTSCHSLATGWVVSSRFASRASRGDWDDSGVSLP
mmetsp:Transcript_20114/g.48822  ORF Transcript_20114/g.48822 Transcript_20114/m.48822 type:complete len:289 (+) Transcript_20114:1752-2618(+)